MQLTTLDWSFVIGFLVISLVIGLIVSRSAGRSEADYFLGGRNMPWWLLGFSMVATTFSTDTPNLVTDLVRQQGVAGNWNWWAFLLTGMLTVFVYARLWRRSGVTTDVEFYSIRYSGSAGRFLRVFRACYLGIAFNILIMAMVSVAAIKIGAVMLGLSPWQTLGLAMLVTVIVTSLGGLKGVLLTDSLLFIMAMVGSFAAAYFALGHESVGGLAGMVEQFQASDVLREKLQLFPSTSNTELFVGVFATSLAVQWWAAYYPGAEPGGGGYLVQRMLAAKNEKHAVGATLFFNVAHYALRPWPWIIVALCSLLVFPELSDIKETFPKIPDAKLRHDVAYSAMIMKTVPSGWLGLILTSLMAAYMSTVSTQLNWGSSYIVHDLLPWLKPNATTRQKVWVGRLSPVVLMTFAAIIAMYIENSKQAFDLVILIGAGTGLLFILRWFWWRINAWCEIVAMGASFTIAMILNNAAVGTAISKLVGDGLVNPTKVCIGVLGTTVAWVVTAFVTQPTDKAVLRDFCRLINPAGKGWDKIRREAEKEGVSLESEHAKENITLGIILTIVGSVGVYTVLFATGYWIYGETKLAILCTVLAIASTGGVVAMWKGITADQTK